MSPRAAMVENVFMVLVLELLKSAVNEWMAGEARCWNQGKGNYG